MNRNEARKAAEVMLAYADGKEVEWFPKDRDGRWIRANDPGFDWFSNDYRIKPQPKYRPFKDAEECWQEMQKHQPFGWVEDKNNNLFRELTLICDSGASFFNNRFTFQYLFDDYFFIDGEPFGVREK